MLWLSSVQSLSRVRLFVTPWIAACQASLSILNSWSLLKLMSIEPVMPSNHLILCHPLLLPPSIFPSTRVFSSESFLWIRWPNYWSFTFSISPSNEYSGLISFRMNGLDLAVQGTLKSLLQHHSSKHQFFGAQLSLWSNSHIHTCYGYGNVIHCLSGQYNKTVLLSGQLYFAAINNHCLLAYSVFHVLITDSFQIIWLNNKNYFNMYKLINSLFLFFFPPQRFLSYTLFLSVISNL